MKNYFKDTINYSKEKLQETWNWVTEDIATKCFISCLGILGVVATVILIWSFIYIFSTIVNISRLNNIYLGKKVTIGEIEGIVTYINSDRKITVVTKNGKSFECDVRLVKLVEEIESRNK